MRRPREAHWSIALRALDYITSGPGKAWCTGYMEMYAFLDTLTQVMLVTEATGSLLLDIVPLLEEIL